MSIFPVLIRAACSLPFYDMVVWRLCHCACVAALATSAWISLKLKRPLWLNYLPEWASCLYSRSDKWMPTEYFYQLKLKDGSHTEGRPGIRLAEGPCLAKGYFNCEFTRWNSISDLLFKFTYSSSLQVGTVIGWNSHDTVRFKSINITSQQLSFMDEWEGNHDGTPPPAIKSQHFIN